MLVRQSNRHKSKTLYSNPIKSSHPNVSFKQSIEVFVPLQSIGLGIVSLTWIREYSFTVLIYSLQTNFWQLMWMTLCIGLQWLCGLINCHVTFWQGGVFIHPAKLTVQVISSHLWDLWPQSYGPMQDTHSVNFIIHKFQEAVLISGSKPMAWLIHFSLDFLNGSRSS